MVQKHHVLFPCFLKHFRQYKPLRAFFLASFFFREKRRSCESLICSQHRNESVRPSFSKVYSSFHSEIFPISISIDSSCLYFALCLLLQPSPCGFGEDQGLLNNHCWIFSPQKLNLHLLPHRAQLQRQVGKCQTLLGTVAVGSRCRIADHLVKNQG